VPLSRSVFGGTHQRMLMATKATHSSQNLQPEELGRTRRSAHRHDTDRSRVPFQPRTIFDRVLSFVMLACAAVKSEKHCPQPFQTWKQATDLYHTSTNHGTSAERYLEKERVRDVPEMCLMGPSVVFGIVIHAVADGPLSHS
jgi:hypothetical protein